MPLKKINREELWKRHQAIQFQFKQWEKWYDANSNVILDLDERRKEITKRYFHFENEEPKVNAQKQYMPLNGADLTKYDIEMGVLMSGFENIEE